MPPEATEPVQAYQKTVLVVDDEEDILESIRDLVEATLPGVDVLVAPHAKQALKILDERDVDLIISDYKMPDMDGLEFLQEAYRRRPHVPRVMITAFPDLEVAIGAINDARIENFFTKPLDPDRIVGVIEEILAARHPTA